ncbi:hypothetical protein GCM10009777_32640 [Microbacterium pumilum]|uniref:Amino acid permease n=1 Tax=Microbacterium pumilum TaxID=344165 RepID=A0ABN2SXQ9_9MICO
MGTPDNANREPLHQARYEPSVSWGLGILVGDLLVWTPLIAAMAGVNQVGAMILVIYVSA